jgi:ribosomal protein L3 glutamine methyltransferase
MDEPFLEALSALSNVRDVMRFAIIRFNDSGVCFGHGSDNAHDEAAYLVGFALHLQPEILDTYQDARLTPSEMDATLNLIEQRIRERVPSAYLTHEAWLAGYRFYVDERVLVPRSFIAELLVERLSPWVADPARITSALDMCTGGGSLAILLALNFPYAAVDAADISPAALEVARRNVADYGLSDQVSLVQSDMFSALEGRRYDLIISNPPYVNAASMQTLPEEYLHEPRLALAGGEDGLDLVRMLLAQAAEHLNDDGLLIVEVGHNRLELEMAYPDVAFTWLDTQAGDEFVFLLTKEQLEALRPEK